MPTQYVLQQYHFKNTGLHWCKLPLDKELHLCCLYKRPQQNVQTLYSKKYNVFLCVDDAIKKHKNPYAAYQNLKSGVTIWLRWPSENIIYKYGDFWDLDSAEADVKLLRFSEHIEKLTWAEFASLNSIMPITDAGRIKRLAMQ